MNHTSITTIGEARVTDAGRDVLAFHLHRYLAHWLAKTGVERVWVTTGWEHSSVAGVTVEVGRRHSAGADVPWTFHSLVDTHNQTADRVVIETPERRLDVVPVSEPSEDETPVLLGFVLVERGVSSELSAELEIHTGEAIRAARRNGVRLFFDECDERDMKALLYDALNKLPEWVGCDVAAAVVLANSLDAMDIEHASQADFYVMAERLFSADTQLTRLVGLSIDTRDDIRTVVDAAIEWLAVDPKHRPVSFVRRGDTYVDHAGEPAVSIGHVDGRPDDSRSVLVPLTADRGETELLGFLCLAFSGHHDVPASMLELLHQLGQSLGHVLRTSPLYTISAGRLRLLRQIRGICEAHVAAPGSATLRRNRVIRDVVDLVQLSTGVPAFSIGFVSGDPRKLHYVASYGWSTFDEIELPVDMPDDGHADSGISALAVRLNRPVVLAGGRLEGDHQEFKNFLWVNEATGQIVDTRAPGRDVTDQPGWTRLGHYYKPARTGAYATVAFPVVFDGRVLGVAALEVDRDTDWTWWAGYGGEQLWELVCSELAFALWALDRELDG